MFSPCLFCFRLKALKRLYALSYKFNSLFQLINLDLKFFDFLLQSFYLLFAFGKLFIYLSHLLQRLLCLSQ